MSGDIASAHAAEAVGFDRRAYTATVDDGMAAFLSSRAQTAALLALVEEQRTANLIAWVHRYPVGSAVREELVDGVDERLGLRASTEPPQGGVVPPLPMASSDLASRPPAEPSVEARLGELIAAAGAWRHGGPSLRLSAAVDAYERAVA